MSSTAIEIPVISDLALEIMKRVIDENEKSQKITDQQSGPIPLASAMSDFFEIASSLENGGQLENPESITELAHYATDLVDRLQAQVFYLDIHDQRDRISQLFVSLAVWFARQNAQLENLKGAADSFAILVNAEKDTAELARLSRQMDEVLQAASEELQQDQDKSDQWRPWRTLTLNSGVAATRSYDPDLMRDIFEKMEQRLPAEMTNFFSDGKRQVQSQKVPEKVRDVILHFSDKWSSNTPH